MGKILSKEHFKPAQTVLVAVFLILSLECLKTGTESIRGTGQGKGQLPASLPHPLPLSVTSYPPELRHQKEAAKAFIVV